MDAFAAGTALCAPFLAQLPVSGLSICVLSESGVQSTVAASDRVAARLEQLQFQLGEGPTADVVRLQRPVLMPDLAAEAARFRWPVFGPSAIEAGSRGLYAFPMLLGPIAVGVVNLYDRAPRTEWSEGLLRVAVRLASAAARPAIELAARSAAEDSPPTGWQRSEMRREVHQAGGMLMVQLDCGIDEAMVRLKAHAFAVGRPLDAVARDVVSGLVTGGHLED